MSAYKIVVTDDRYKTYKEEQEVLKNLAAELIIENCTTPAEVIDACSDADGIMCNLAPMPAEVNQH